MTWLVALIGVAGLFAGLNYLSKMAERNLTDLLKAIKKEKEIVLQQRAKINGELFGMRMMGQQIEDAHKRVQNGINTVKALASHINDPVWMSKFEKYRDKAPWN